MLERAPALNLNGFNNRKNSSVLHGVLVIISVFYDTKYNIYTAIHQRTAPSSYKQYFYNLMTAQ